MAKGDLIEQRRLVDRGQFVGRVLMALVRKAHQVMDEDPVQPQYAERSAHARVILHDQHRHAELYAVSVATGSFAGDDPTDDEIIRGVRDAFNAHAGLTKRPVPGP